MPSLAVLLGLALAASTAPPPGPAAFPIGFWSHTPADMLTDARMDRWVELGATVMVADRFDMDAEGMARAHHILRRAAERDIRLYPRLDSLYLEPAAAAMPLPADYPERVRAAWAAFGASPAMAGPLIANEPEAPDFARTAEAVRVVEREAPGWTAFVNLLPWWHTEARVGYDDWPAYLDAWLETSGADLLCYDLYAQMTPGGQGRAVYYRNLRVYGEAARSRDLPWWTTLLAQGMGLHRQPDDDALRWQLHTAVACGARGILWYPLFGGEWAGNRGHAPLDAFYEPSPAFDRFRRLHRAFHMTYGRRFLDLAFRRAMHWPEPPEGGMPLAADGPLRAIATPVAYAGDAMRDRCPVLVGEFEGPEGRTWLAVVNDTMDTHAMVRLELAGADTPVFAPQFDTTPPEPAGMLPWGDSRPGDGDRRIVHTWLEPGGMRLFRLGD
jgi:hypothetical protein